MMVEQECIGKAYAFIRTQIIDIIGQIDRRWLYKHKLPGRIGLRYRNPFHVSAGTNQLDVLVLLTSDLTQLLIMQ